MSGKIYKFGDYLLDPSQLRLQKNGQEISLPPKVFEVLTLLVERNGLLVNQAEIMKEVWQETFVEETNLRFCIHSLRKVLGKDSIETVPKRGYRFVCEVDSFSPEEFIKKYTSDKEAQVGDKRDVSQIEEKKSSVFFAKPVWILGIVILLAGVGVSAFIIWQKRNTQTEKNPHQLQTLTVLPFMQVGDNPASSNVSQKGLADILITNLTRIRELDVTPTGKIQKFFGQEFDSLAIGKEFNADIVLDGSYLYDGDRLRVNARLLRVKDGETLWTDTINVESKNQIETESVISFRIARKIELMVARIKDENLLRNQNISEEISKDYLLARQVLRSNEHNRRKEMIGLFEKIVAREPNWALGHAGYAEALTLTRGARYDWEKIVAAARKTIELDNTRAEAFVILGIFYGVHWDWENAEQSFKTAIQLNPKLALSYHEYGRMLDIKRRFAEAETMLKKAIELEPFSPLYYTSLCEHYYYDKRFDLALTQCNIAKNIEPDFWLLRKKLYWIYVQKGMYDEIEKLEFGDLSAADKAGDKLAKPLMERNMRLYWQRNIKLRLNHPAKSDSPVAIATFYAQLGDKENTLNYLEHASQKIEFELQYANPNPVFDLVRKDKRFVDVMKKINLNL